MISNFLNDMKMNKNSALTTVIIIVSIGLLTGCSKDNPFMNNAKSAKYNAPAAEDLLYSDLGDEELPDCSFIIVSSASLSPVEIEMLEFVREEEKMAHDVYYVLSGIYKKPVFKNIMKSEQEHMDRVLCLLIHYQLEDPASDEIGKFSNPELQKQYDALIDLGITGIVDGLTAGALIEDFDIDNINKWIAQTDNEAILDVFTNIVCGSGNHLISFTELLDGFGEEYSPTFLSRAAYQAILDEGKQQCGL